MMNTEIDQINAKIKQAIESLERSAVVLHEMESENNKLILILFLLVFLEIIGVVLISSWMLT